MKKLKLKRSEIKFLKKFTRTGEKKARMISRANILLLLHKNESGPSIAKKLNVDADTVYSTKRKYLQNGLEFALIEKPRSGQPKKYDEKNRVEIVAFACTKAPEGRKRWTVRLLAEELRKQKGFETINRETIRLMLKKTKLNLG